MTRRASRADANEAEIFAALRDAGASVLDLHALGIKGCPDALAAFGGDERLLEIKAPGGRLRPEQAEWHAAWRGRPVAVVRSAEEALRAVGALP